MRSGESHTYTLHLPENSELAVRTGIDFFGYPKFLASVNYEH